MKAKTKVDFFNIFPLIEESLAAGGSLLIFCQSKFTCER